MTQTPAGVVTVPCPSSVDTALQRLTEILAERHLVLFTVVDHSGEAAKAGLAMPNTKLVIFGSPAGGTGVMLAAPLAALDLPLKLLLWEAADGGAFVSYNRPDYVADRYGLDPDLAGHASARSWRSPTRSRPGEVTGRATISPVDRPLTNEDYERLLQFRIGLRRFLRWSEAQAAAAGLTPAQHQLLLAIRGHPDPAGPTIGDVAESLLLRHHSAVGLVDRAAAAHLVRRRTDEHDRRVVRLALTATGSKQAGPPHQRASRRARRPRGADCIRRGNRPPTRRTPTADRVPAAVPGARAARYAAVLGGVSVVGVVPPRLAPPAPKPPKPAPERRGPNPPNPPPDPGPGPRPKIGARWPPWPPSVARPIAKPAAPIARPSSTTSAAASHDGTDTVARRLDDVRWTGSWHHPPARRPSGWAASARQASSSPVWERPAW